ncbi:MAG TPA: hypothetical protein DEG28_01015 [Porphyromonadaceae bacterium]|nr:hypothetical protein [Porphyromonadaceae bacterium]
MKNKAKQEVDFYKTVISARWRNERFIMTQAVMHYGMSGINKSDFTFEDEKVKNYSRKMFTVRCRGKLLFRRFPADLHGLCFKYESPIFNNVTE